MQYSSEVWDGQQFQDHPIWVKHGPRSLLLILSLDWFPPFKTRDYSVGVLVATPANLSSLERARRKHSWVLAVIEGPDEPTHVIECLRPCFEELRFFDDHGLEVFDSLTSKSAHIYISSPLVSADVPACARLGNHVGHRAYFACIACDYKACVCGCKSDRKKGEQDLPARWDNRGYRPSMPEHALITGTERTSKKGEHIVYVDADVLLPHHLRLEQIHRQGLAEITLALETESVQAEINRVCQRTRCNGPSVLTLLNPDHFSFINGFCVEAMHTVIKGTFYRLWLLSIGDRYAKEWYNVQYYEKGLRAVKHRLAKFHFPIGFPSATKIVARRHSLKAEQLYTIIRICGVVMFHSVLPKSCVRVWSLFCKLYTNLLHHHVSKSWMNRSIGGMRCLIREAFTMYLRIYGPCNMPSNFHKLLHCWIDFHNWGPLRSHWAFPYERLYGAMMTTSRMQNRSHVTQSIVNNVKYLYVDTTVHDEDDGEFRVPLVHTTPPHVLASDCEVQALLRAEYSWVKHFLLVGSRRWHVMEYIVLLKAGESLTSSCFYIVIGILVPNATRNSRQTGDEVYFVLRKVLHLVPQCFFDDAPPFYTLLRDDMEGEKYLGSQMVLSTSEVITTNQAVSAVATFSLNHQGITLIPTMGLIDFEK